MLPHISGLARNANLCIARNGATYTILMSKCRCRQAVNALHAIARARRCPPKTKYCAVALLYNKGYRNDILTGAKLFSGKFGSVIVMVADLYDKIGGDDVLADAHAKCCKTFLAKRSAVTCSHECSEAWRILYRSGFDLINRDAILEKKRDKWAANAKEINAARRAARDKKPRAPARKPWLAEGISRTTWYRRNGKLTKR